MLCQSFRLPYLSPFIESVMTTEDWLTFLQVPQAHLSRELIYHEKIGTADGREFPVFRMGEEGLKVYFLYETDVEKIRRDWPERVKGINWGDLLLMMYTETPEYLDRFDRLPYGRGEFAPLGLRREIGGDGKALLRFVGLASVWEEDRSSAEMRRFERMR